MTWVDGSSGLKGTLGMVGAGTLDREGTAATGDGNARQRGWRDPVVARSANQVLSGRATSAGLSHIGK